MSTVMTNYAVLVDTQLKVAKANCTVRFLFIPSDSSVEALINSLGSE
jgi:chemotaxis protein CheY-P-specific phosphatase CheC